jgi:hypothetical protein
LDQAVEIELSFLADLGFKLEILTDDWGFWRTASDAVLGRRLQAVLAEDERRQDT